MSAFGKCGKFPYPNNILRISAQRKGRPFISMERGGWNVHACNGETSLYFHNSILLTLKLRLLSTVFIVIF
jgi:hypothetical protein